MNIKLRQLWLAVRIWLLAVVTNAAFGTLFLNDFSYRADTWQLFETGIVWGGIFSLPVMLALYYLIKHCVETNKTGAQIFWKVIGVSMLVTVLVFIVFWCVIGIGMTSFALPLLGIATLSGIIAISIQYRSFKRLGSDFDTIQAYSHE